VRVPLAQAPLFPTLRANGAGELNELVGTIVYMAPEVIKVGSLLLFDFLLLPKWSYPTELPSINTFDFLTTFHLSQ
jgi:hypothetical protein